MNEEEELGRVLE